LGDGQAKKSLTLELDRATAGHTERDETPVTKPIGGDKVEVGEKEETRAGNSAMQAMNVDDFHVENGDDGKEDVEKKKEKNGRGGRYKKMQRTNATPTGTGCTVLVRKTMADEGPSEEMEVEGKKQRVVAQNSGAGLSEQPCKDQ